MKLNVEELMREAEKLAASEQGDAPYNNALGADWFTRKHEAFARLIVERCAAVADDADCRFDGHAIATEIRDMLEDK